MVGLNLEWVLGPGPAGPGVHLVSVALTKALRTYSRSRLEDVCAARGHARAGRRRRPPRRGDRASAEALAVFTGLVLAALLGVLAAGIAPSSDRAAVVSRSPWPSACSGYVLAGVVGRVFAET